MADYINLSSHGSICFANLHLKDLTERCYSLCLFLRFIAVLRVGERYLPLLDWACLLYSVWFDVRAIRSVSVGFWEICRGCLLFCYAWFWTLFSDEGEGALLNVLSISSISFSCSSIWFLLVRFLSDNRQSAFFAAFRKGTSEEILFVRKRRQRKLRYRHP